MQFWVLDNLLKSSAGGGEAPDAPLSPGKFKVSYEPILDGANGGGANGRRRKGSASGFSWFDPSQPGMEVSTAAASHQQQQQHSWLRPTAWTWGSQGQGGPGTNGRGAGNAGASASGGAAAPYRPPQPDVDGRHSQLPPWMTSTTGAAAYRPYDDDDSASGHGGAIA